MKTPSGTIAVILFLLTISVPLSAQQSTFTKVFYDNLGSAQAYSIIKSFDNNYMVAGVKDAGGLLLKMDPGGTILWNKKYESTGWNYFYDIVSTTDSNFVMAGYHKIPVSYDRDLLCVKVNPEGDTLWAKTIDHGKDEYALTIRQTYDDGFILFGYGQQNVAPFTFLIVDKLDPDGNLEWSRSLEACNFYHHACSILQTPDSGYFVTCYIETYPSFEFIPVFIKLSSDGTIVKSYQYTAPSVTGGFGSDLVLTDNGLIFCILIDNGILLMKTDFSGNVVWSKNNPAASGQYSAGSSIPILYTTIDNGYAFTAWDDLSGGGQLYKADSSGNFLWMQNLTLHPSDIIETDDTGLIVLGNGPLYGYNLSDTYNEQIGIIKTDFLGNSSDCVSSGSSSTSTITSNLVPISVTSSPWGTQTFLTVLISDAGLSSVSGCVEYVPGVKEIDRERNGLLVYPNPSNGMIRIKTDPTSYGDLKLIRIYNGTGECIYKSADPSSFSSAIDLTASADGIYYIQAVFKDAVRTQLFTIIH